MISFIDRTAPLYGLLVYFLAAIFNPILAAALYNVYLLTVVIVYLGKIVKLNKGKSPAVRSINTKAWVGTLAVMLITVWGIVTMGSWLVLATGIIFVMWIENYRKEKLNKE